MNDLKTVRDALEAVKGHSELLHGDQAKYNLFYIYAEIGLATLDRMIETPVPKGWSAIETAPKDGTEILLALWSGHPEHKTSFCWAINGHYKDGFFYSKDPMVGKLASPTHWQHITAPTPAPTDCQHEIIDIRNEVVQSGYMCKKCNAVFSAGDHNAQSEKVDVEKLKREVALNLVVKFARDWEVGIHGMSFQEHCLREIIDHLAARFDFVEKEQK